MLNNYIHSAVLDQENDDKEEVKESKNASAIFSSYTVIPLTTGNSKKQQTRTRTRTIIKLIRSLTQKSPNKKTFEIYSLQYIMNIS